MKRLHEALQANPNVKFILENLQFPYNLEWFLVGGCINQTVWNSITGRDWNYGIGDYDIPYWDSDLSSEKERAISKEVNLLMSDIGVKMDVVNQARVHLWFKEFFGADAAPFSSLRQALTTHPFTVMGIGINKNEMYTPFGVEDTFSMLFRYNPTTHIPRKHVIRKMTKWRLKWPELKVVTESFPTGFFD